MHKTIVAAWSGMLAACSLPVMPPAPLPVQSMVPTLASRNDESADALGAMRQARTLREAAAAPPVAAQGAGAAIGHWPAGMARVEVRQLGAGLVEVVRVEGGAPAPTVGRKPGAPPPRSQAPMRIEVSNGNGIHGMAAAVAQQLRAEGMQVVRLTNTIPFTVEKTRIEIRGNRDPQLRIVLGKDLEIKKPPAGSRRQAP